MAIGAAVVWVCSWRHGVAFILLEQVINLFLVASYSYIVSVYDMYENWGDLVFKGFVNDGCGLLLESWQMGMI